MKVIHANVIVLQGKKHGDHYILTGSSVRGVPDADGSPVRDGALGIVGLSTR